MIEISYADARSHLGRLLDRVTIERETLVINRPGKEAVAMIPASELSSLIETRYLLASPRNARCLLEAMHSSLADECQPTTVEELRREFGLHR
jgi:antitoxin YefM